MRSDAEIRAFLRNELAAALREHEQRRREIYAAIPRWPFVVLGLAGVVAAVIVRAFWPLLAPVLYGVLAVTHAHRQIRADCKRGLVGPALRFWNPTLEYEASRFLAEPIFRRSALFSGERWNDYDGEDWVHGKIGETEFRLSELCVKRTRSGEKSDIVVFRGLFVVADFHKSFRGRTLLFPDVAERRLGVFGRVLQNLDAVSGCELVQLESPEFEEVFCTYSTDPVEARYILTPSLMERILSFRRRSGCELRIAFIDENLYLALPSVADLFERVPDSLEHAEQAMRAWVADLEFATAVIEELGLNTRIWSKGGAAA